MGRRHSVRGVREWPWLAAGWRHLAASTTTLPCVVGWVYYGLRDWLGLLRLAWLVGSTTACVVGWVYYGLPGWAACHRRSAHPLAIVFQSRRRIGPIFGTMYITYTSAYGHVNTGVWDMYIDMCMCVYVGLHACVCGLRSQSWVFKRVKKKVGLRRQG